MGFERKKHSLRLQSRGESLEGIETLASLSNFFFSFFFFLHREKVEKLHDTKLKRFLRARRIKLISNPTFHFRPARRFSFPQKNFYQLLSFDFYFFLPLSFSFYDNFVVNLKTGLFYFFVRRIGYCIFENSVQIYNLSYRFIQERSQFAYEVQ